MKEKLKLWVIVTNGLMAMKIIDLSDEYVGTYCLCLEDWSDEMKDAGSHKACWYQDMKGKGLGVKLAINEEGKAVGMIHYLPVEHSYAEGSGLYAILCIWVHGYKQGVGNYQKKGIGKNLLKAAERDVFLKGAKGMVAWGLSIPVWMKASWFKRQGYKEVDRDGFLGPALVWKPFTEDALPPKWVKRKKRPEKKCGEVTVTGFINGWCNAQNIAFERAKRAASELGGQVAFREINTRNRETFLEWGISDALYIGNRRINTGPPPSFERLRKKIEKQIHRTRSK